MAIISQYLQRHTLTTDWDPLKGSTEWESNKDLSTYRYQVLTPIRQFQKPIAYLYLLGMFILFGVENMTIYLPRSTPYNS